MIRFYDIEVIIFNVQWIKWQNEIILKMIYVSYIIESKMLPFIKERWNERCNVIENVSNC